MAGLLTGQLAKQIYAGFRGKLLKGTLRRNYAATSTGLDSRGDPVDTDPQTWPMQGFIDKLSSVFKGREGIPETDSQVNIFAQSLPAGIKPTKDDLALFNGQWWQLRAVDTDPATALWIAAGFQVRAPE